MFYFFIKDANSLSNVLHNWFASRLNNVSTSVVVSLFELRKQKDTWHNLLILLEDFLILLDCLVVGINSICCSTLLMSSRLSSNVISFSELVTKIFFVWLGVVGHDCYKLINKYWHLHYLWYALELCWVKWVLTSSICFFFN